MAAVISGALMSVQGVWNTQITKVAGQWVTNGFVQATALVTCLVFWFFTGRQSFAGVWNVENRWMLLTGVLGAFITLTVIVGTHRLGPARAALLIVVTQITVSYLIELFGLWGVEREPFVWRKLLGLVVAAAGILLFKWE